MAIKKIEFSKHFKLKDKPFLKVLLHLKILQTTTKDLSLLLLFYYFIVKKNCDQYEFYFIIKYDT